MAKRLIFIAACMLILSTTGCAANTTNTIQGMTLSAPSGSGSVNGADKALHPELNTNRAQTSIGNDNETSNESGTTDFSGWERDGDFSCN